MKWQTYQLVSLVISSPSQEISISIRPVTYIWYARYPSRLIGGCCTTSPPPKSVREIIFLSVTLLTATWCLVELNPESTIASTSLLFITVSCRKVEYIHIWLKLLILTVLPNFCQAPGKKCTCSSNVEYCLLQTQWSATHMELGLLMAHERGWFGKLQLNRPMICTVVDHDLELHWWEHVHKIHHTISVEDQYFVLSYSQSLDTDVQRPFYSVATVALLPYS